MSNTDSSPVQMDMEIHTDDRVNHGDTHICGYLEFCIIRGNQIEKWPLQYLNTHSTPGKPPYMWNMTCIFHEHGSLPNVCQMLSLRMKN